MRIPTPLRRLTRPMIRAHIATVEKQPSRSEGDFLILQMRRCTSPSPRCFSAAATLYHKSRLGFFCPCALPALHPSRTGRQSVA
eukprot:6106258-Pyramimonas_sp.AAC.1